MLRMVVALTILPLTLALAGRAPKGKPNTPEKDEQVKLDQLKGKLKGTIAWSSSRNEGMHHIYLMNLADYSITKLTKANNTDWYSRISPDGKQVIFTRSKLAWTNEMDANYPERWDTWIINMDGTGEKKLIPNATWATWRPDGKSIIFSRGENIFQVNADGTEEKEIVNGEKDLMGGIAQSPHMSDDGKLMVVTLRGKQRETGILNLSTRKWYRSMGGGGCQINFFPNTHKIFWIQPTGNGGTQVFNTELNKDGGHSELKGKDEIGGKSARMIDLPGRRSHEYFPQVTKDSKWLTWCATARGHDHDVVDYEVHIWKIGEPYENAVRLTYHSGNDRWPDIHLEE